MQGGLVDAVSEETAEGFRLPNRGYSLRDTHHAQILVVRNWRFDWGSVGLSVIAL